MSGKSGRRGRRPADIDARPPEAVERDGGSSGNILWQKQDDNEFQNALLTASRAVLEHDDFEAVAERVFAAAKKLIGAAAGYVALLKPDGSGNEVLVLDSGGLPCTVDPRLPMPIRGLRAEAYRTAKPVYENDFAKSSWARLLPSGHARLESVLFAPLELDGAAAGLLGLANKPGGFTEHDAMYAAALGEFAAIALRKSRTRDLLEASERRFRTLTQTATDGIICINGAGDITLWNEGAQRIFGYSAAEAEGKPLTLIIPERLRHKHIEAHKKLAAGGRPSLIGRVLQTEGLRRDGTEVPLELSLATYKTKEGVFFTGIIRDITDRRLAEETLQKAHDRLSAVLDSITDAFFSLDRDFRVVYLNGGAERIFQKSRREVMGRNLWKLFPEAVGSRFQHEYEKAMVENRKAHFEEFYAPFNRWYEVHAYGSPGGLSVYLTDITERKEAEERIRKHNAVLERQIAEGKVRARALAAEAVLAGMQERHRLAEVLHDNLQQLLVGARLQVELLQRAKEGFVKATSASVRDLLVQSLSVSRSLIAELTPKVLDEGGLLPALEWLAGWVKDKHGLSVEMTVEGGAFPIRQEMAVILFQAVRELLLNIVKHAGVKTARLEVRRAGDEVCIAVADDGIGFDPELLPAKLDASRGFGLANVRDKLELLGGRMEIVSSPGRGSRIKLVAL